MRQTTRAKMDMKINSGTNGEFFENEIIQSSVSVETENFLQKSFTENNTIQKQKT